MDELQVKACNAYSKLSLKETPTLFLEFHGSQASVAEQAERFGEIAAELGGGPRENGQTFTRCKLNLKGVQSTFWIGKNKTPAFQESNTTKGESQLN
jgi:D-lactate dehydrogenase (cytochrome)